MALQSLRFSASNPISETKSGVYIYAGEPAAFHEWEFRTALRADATDEKERAKMVNSIVESLRGDAATVAMEIGRAGVTPWRDPKRTGSPLFLSLIHI